MFKSVIILFSLMFILMFIFMGKYFNNGNTANVFPRLTLDLYDDLDAFMQYDY